MVKKFLAFSKPYIRYYIIVFCSVVLTTLLSLPIPLFIRHLIDNVVVEKNMKDLNAIILLIFGTYIFKAVFTYLQAYIYGYIGDNISFDIRKKMLGKVQSLPLEYLQQKATGETVSLVMNDVGIIRNMFTSSFVSVFSNTLTLAAILCILLSINWRLTLVNCLTIPLFWFISQRSKPKLRENSLETQEQSSRIMGKLYENFSNQKIIRAFNIEELFLNKIYQELRKLIHIHLRGVKTGTLVSQINYLIVSIGPLLVLWLGSEQTIRGVMTIGSLIAFYQYLIQIYNPINSYAGLNVKIQSMWGAMTRISDFLSLPGEDKDGAKLLENVSGEIEMRDVSFKYASSDSYILKNIDLRIKPGEFVGIVGSSGAGKTTISNLLMRFFPVVEGAISLDGININEIQSKSFNHHVGIVTQDDYLFQMSIEDNIRLGKSDATREEIREVARMAQIDDFILQLPDQYDTIISERGENLSGGQKQRISWARVFLKQPGIVILDEATSSLDSDTEQLIYEAFEKTFGDSTRIIITHRFSTLARADRILVLKDGQILEEGDHEQLIGRRGHYYQLYLKQIENCGDEDRRVELIG